MLQNKKNSGTKDLTRYRLQRNQRCRQKRSKGSLMHPRARKQELTRLPAGPGDYLRTVLKLLLLKFMNNVLHR